MRELLLRLIKNPTTMGCFSLWLNDVIRCGRPPSNTRKSLATRFETNLPLSTVTVTGTMTSVTPDTKLGGLAPSGAWGFGASACAGGCGGGVACWDTPG